MASDKSSRALTMDDVVKTRDGREAVIVEIDLNDLDCIAEITHKDGLKSKYFYYPDGKFCSYNSGGPHPLDLVLQ